MMKFREMSLWHKLSIVAAVLVGGVVTRYEHSSLWPGVISDLPAGLYDMTKWDEYRPESNVRDSCMFADLFSRKE